MKWSNKASISLSTNFLVGLILGFVMFGLGLVFLYRILAIPEEVSNTLIPDSIKIAEDQCVRRGEKICNHVKIVETQTGKIANFYVTVNNIAGREVIFQPQVSFSLLKTDSGTQNTLPTNGQPLRKWTFTDISAQSLQHNEYHTFSAPFRIPNGIPDGTYVFNYHICYNDNTIGPTADGCTSAYPDKYGSTQQFTIRVN